MPAAASLMHLVAWAWRRLTSMRTAVVLLSLLALVAVPGSLLPQRNVASDPGAVEGFYRENPSLAPWLDRLGLFDVYASAWFAAVYVLLLVSMTGCVLPRCLKLWREARAEPPAASANLLRMPGSHRLVLRSDTESVVTTTTALLRERRHRVRVVAGEVRAERGQVRELGNLVFHFSLLVLLLGVGLGKLWGFEARVAVIEGQGFTNTVSQYDEFSPSFLTDIDGLEPIAVSLKSFDASFAGDTVSRGEPRSFEATVRWSNGGGRNTEQVVRPNDPLDVEETKFFLTGHGYAPRITVTDGRGDLVYSGPTIFYPVDSSYTSDGIVKVPDARPQQLAFQGLFLPTAERSGDGAPFSSFPAPVNPRLLLTGWTGDLGMDAGDAQNVFALDTSTLERLGGGVDRALLAPGETVRLPDGLGSVRFDGVDRFANFQVAYDPGKEISLVAAIMLLLGLTISLTMRRWRVWVRVRPGDVPTEVVVEVGGRALTRRSTDQEAMVREVQDLSRALERAYPQPSDHRLEPHPPEGART